MHKSHFASTVHAADVTGSQPSFNSILNKGTKQLAKLTYTHTKPVELAALLVRLETEKENQELFFHSSSSSHKRMKQVLKVIALVSLSLRWVKLSVLETN